jgi:carboxyl-terminal processing protease
VIGERTWGKGSVQTLIQLEGGKSLLKLTTASYRRPSGKNIHRFPDAKETDEWGVMPDAGMKIELGDEEMTRLIQNRRERDILQSPVKDGEKKADAKQNSPPPVDRQLQAAVKYLTAELAKRRWKVRLTKKSAGLPGTRAKHSIDGLVFSSNSQPPPGGLY